jgi:hypothetical protein
LLLKEKKVNDRSMKFCTNLPFPFIHPVADILQPNVAITPTIVTADTNSLSSQQHSSSIQVTYTCGIRQFG